MIMAFFRSELSVFSIPTGSWLIQFELGGLLEGKVLPRWIFFISNPKPYLKGRDTLLTQTICFAVIGMALTFTLKHFVQSVANRVRSNNTIVRNDAFFCRLSCVWYSTYFIFHFITMFRPRESKKLANAIRFHHHTYLPVGIDVLRYIDFIGSSVSHIYEKFLGEPISLRCVRKYQLNCGKWVN